MLFGDWRVAFDEITVLPDRDHEGRRVHVVKLESGEAPAVTLLIDPETGDPLQASSLVLVPGVGGLPVETRFEDFREVGGLRMPFRSIEKNQMAGRSIAEITEIETGIVVEAEVFRMSPPAP